MTATQDTTPARLVALVETDVVPWLASRVERSMPRSSQKSRVLRPRTTCARVLAILIARSTRHTSSPHLTPTHNSCSRSGQPDSSVDATQLISYARTQLLLEFWPSCSPGRCQCHIAQQKKVTSYAHTTHLLLEIRGVPLRRQRLR